jgi:hypothetical protein
MEWTRKELAEGSRLMMQVLLHGGGAVRFNELFSSPLKVPLRYFGFVDPSTIVPHQSFLPHFAL